MTGYRRANGRSRMPRRYVPWPERVFHLEQSKTKVQVEAKWHEGLFLGIKDRCGWNATRNCFFEKHSQSSKKRILETVCCSTASEEHRGNCNLELKEES